MNRVAKNAILVVSSSVLGQLMSFFILSIVGNRLNAAALGEIGTVQAIMTYFTLFVTFGLQTYGIREIAKGKEKISKVVGDILSFRAFLFIISFIVIIVISLGIWKFNHDMMLAELLILYGITLIPSALAIDWVYSGIQKMGYNAIYNILKNAVPFILVYIFLKSSEQIYFVPIFTSIALFIGGIYQFYGYIFKEKLSVVPRLNKETIEAYITYGSPFVISGILAMINGNVDRIVIDFFRGSTEAGVYTAGYTIINFLINIVGMIFIPIFPVMITYFNENSNEKLNELMGRTSKILAAVIIPVATGGIVLCKELIIRLFGKQCASAYISFSILLIYAIILFFRELYGYGLNAANLEKKYVKAVSVSAILNLALNLMLTPKYGMNAAAIITLISEVINFSMMKYYAKDLFVVSNVKNILKVLLPSLLMCVVTVSLKYFNINIVINIIISAAAYSSFIFITKYITISEIKSIIRKG